MHGDLFFLNVQIPIGLIEAIELLRPTALESNSYGLGEARKLIWVFRKTEFNPA